MSSNAEILKDKFRGEIMGLSAIGSGQLALKTGRAAHDAGLRFGVLGQEKEDPAYKISDFFVKGDLNDPHALSLLLEKSKRVCLDTEHTNASFLKELPFEQRRKLLFSPHTLEVSQNKLQMHLKALKNGVPMPRIEFSIDSLDKLQRAFKKFRNKAVLQLSGPDAYDSKGVRFLRNEKEMLEGWEEFSGRGNLFLEEEEKFKKEIAVTIVRGLMGEEVIYPIVELTNRDGILYHAQSPAKLDDREGDDALVLAKLISRTAPGLGLVTTEQFIKPRRLGKGRSSAIMNEYCIGRPHNSHHLTEIANETSQFQQLVLLALDSPPGNAGLKKDYKSAQMVGLIGAKYGPNEVRGWEDIADEFGLDIDIYGKECRPGRKMGDIIWAGNDNLEGNEILDEVVIKLNELNGNIFRYYPLDPNGE